MAKIDNPKTDTLTIGKYERAHASFNVGTNTIDLSGFPTWRYNTETVIDVIFKRTGEETEIDFLSYIYGLIEHETIHKVLCETVGVSACNDLDHTNLEFDRDKEIISEHLFLRNGKKFIVETYGKRTVVIRGH